MASTVGAGACAPRAHRGTTANWVPAAPPATAGTVPATRMRSWRPAAYSPPRGPRMTRAAGEMSTGTRPAGRAGRARAAAGDAGPRAARPEAAAGRAAYRPRARVNTGRLKALPDGSTVTATAAD